MRFLQTLGLSILLAALANPAGANQADSEKPKSPFTISKETTYLTEPIRPDGRVDYVAGINNIFGEGVTPDNNAAVPLAQAAGPNFLLKNHKERFFEILGIAPLPEEGDYLIAYDDFRFKGQTDKNQNEEDASPLNADQKHKLDDEFSAVVAAPWIAKDHPHFAAWMKANEKPLEKIREAAQRTRYYAPMIADQDDYAPMIAVTLEMAQESRSCARALMAHAMLSIGEGKIDEAKRDILACHRLGRLEGQGAFLIDALVAIAIDAMACTGDVALAQSGKLTPREAAAFQEELRKLPPLPKMADKIDLAERMLFLDCAQMVATNGIGSVSRLTGSGGRLKDGKSKSFLNSLMTSAVDWDAVMRRGNAWYDRMVEASRKDKFAERDEAWKSIDQDARQLSQNVKSLKSVKDSLLAGESLRDIASKKMGNILLALLTPALRAVINAEQRSQINCDLSQLALALDAYRGDHSSYPDRLADVAPKYLAEIPKDGFNDRDLIYRREGDGYLLYSVGPDGKDSGGANRDHDPPGDDIAIRTPQVAK